MSPSGSFNNLDGLKDSLDRLAYLMDLEQRLIDEINADRSLTSADRSRLIPELEDRVEHWDWDKDGPDDASPLAI